jgi:hypothetical protein
MSTSPVLTPFRPPAQAVHSTETNEHAQIYRDAIRKERAAETNSIIAAWEAGHAFRQYEDPVTEISALTGMSETYVNKRIRLAGAYTKAKLITAIEQSGAAHFTAFYSWAFSEGTHASNQMFRHRNVHVPDVQWKYFEALRIDVGAAVKELLTVIPPAELHAILKKYVRGEQPAI